MNLGRKGAVFVFDSCSTNREVNSVADFLAKVGIFRSFDLVAWL